MLEEKEERKTAREIKAAKEKEEKEYWKKVKAGRRANNREARINGRKWRRESRPARIKAAKNMAGHLVRMSAASISALSIPSSLFISGQIQTMKWVQLCAEG